MSQLAKHQLQALQGVAEIDEAFFRESFKGRKRGMPRKAHKRAMPAGKRGVSREQIPVSPQWLAAREPATSPSCLASPPRNQWWRP